ncbi:hypothetical protein [Micromonospora sp. NBC_01813]|uniref:hypothetical protein n=1 Tax=Micromonospora sp. NBC_01813 TaxID=2975988 RepID=UPI002DDC25C6|nr:hypothetical protein [Micromonospora sp. NBC_01813]WSA08534.1 hypothetical protein OG958_30865 [Micromonospora sp. NBC_01813]
MATPTVMTPRSPWRRRLVVLTVTGALVVALGVGTAVALRSPARLAATPTPASAAVPTSYCIESDAIAPGTITGGAAEVSTDRPDDGGLDVVESGFAQIGSAAAPITRDGITSVGAIIRNTSEQIAYRTRVTFRVLDESGDSAVLDSADDQTREIPIILPGQQVGVGARYAVRSEGASRIRVAEVAVAINETLWSPARTDPAEVALVGAVTARHLETWRYGPDDLDASVNYELDSPYCSVLTSAGAGVVFRDAAGLVVGGGFDPTASQDGCLPGRSARSALLPRSLPPQADVDRTEIYQYCGPHGVQDSAAAATPF